MYCNKSHCKNSITKEILAYAQYTKKSGRGRIGNYGSHLNSPNPVTSKYILKELQGRRKWHIFTLTTSLVRRSDKGFVNYDRSTGSNLYTSIISENEY